MGTKPTIHDLRKTFEQATLRQRYRSALQIFDRQEQKLRHNAEFWGLYGTLLEYAAQQRAAVVKRELLERAERYYRRATRLDPNCFLGWHGRWRLACKRRERQCVELFHNAHRVAPRRGHIKCLGISYLALGEPQRAIPHFRAALREVRKPHEKMSIHYDLAIVFLKMRNIGRAKRHAGFAQWWFRKLPRSVRVTQAFRKTGAEIKKMLAAFSEHPRRRRTDQRATLVS